MMRQNPQSLSSSSSHLVQIPPKLEQVLATFQNVSLFTNDEHIHDLAGLGIGVMNPWQMPSAVGSTNGFTGSDTSSSPLSPKSPDVKKRNQNFGVLNQNRNGKCQGSIYTRNGRNGYVPHSNISINSYSSHHRIRQGLNNPQRIPMTPQPVPPIQFGHSKSPEQYHSGMRDLTYWLKKLRLHKYTPLFETMTYKEMLSLDGKKLEEMNVTAGAKKKILQSIAKLQERPSQLRDIEQQLVKGQQCVRCAVCTVRQLLWSPFIRYEPGPNHSSMDLDGFFMPSLMIADENIPALIFRVIELLSSMIFPLRKGLYDLEDEYILTMFHMFESVIKNEQFTINQQKRAMTMKRNARLYASPEEMRRHRMGMVSSGQCESCHHAEVVGRERAIERREREEKGERIHMRDDVIGLLDDSIHSREMEIPAQKLPQQQLNIQQRQQKRPASDEDDWKIFTSPSPKMNAPTVAQSTTSSSSSTLLEGFVIPPKNVFSFNSIWTDNRSIWNNENELQSTSSFMEFPEYRSPKYVDVLPSDCTSTPSKTEKPIENEYANVMNQTTFDLLGLLKSTPTNKPPSLSDFAFPDNFDDLDSPGLKKANSTGSGYSSSDSESSAVVSPRSQSISDDTSPPSPTASTITFSTFNNQGIDLDTLLSTTQIHYQTTSSHNQIPQFM